MWSDMYQSPAPSMGHGRLCPVVPLSYASVTVVQPGFVNGGPKRGIEATERGGGGGCGMGVSPLNDGEILKILYEYGNFLHIKCHY